jgi:hypothetical protein
MSSKAWIVELGVELGMLLAIAVPATQELSGPINSRPLAWVPAVLGLGRRRAPGPARRQSIV